MKKVEGFIDIFPLSPFLIFQHKTFHLPALKLSWPLFFIFLIAATSCSSKLTQHKLLHGTTTLIQKQHGIFAVAFKDLSTGRKMFINAHLSFHAASTMKVPVMIEVFKQAAEGKFSLSDSMVIKNAFRSIVDSSLFSLYPKDDSDTSLYKLIGSRRKIISLVNDMIIVSSNLATNMIIEKVGARKVQQTMRQLGAKDIQVLRGVEDGKAFEKGLINTTTAFDLLIILEQMAAGASVSPDASQEMIAILLDQRFNELIPARLPKDVKVAHKTGSISGVHHDAGIVFLPDGRKYVLVLLSKEVENEKAAESMMASLSEMIYQYMMKTPGIKNKFPIRR